MGNSLNPVCSCNAIQWRWWMTVVIYWWHLVSVTWYADAICICHMICWHHLVSVTWYANSILYLSHYMLMPSCIYHVICWFHLASVTLYGDAIGFCHVIYWCHLASVMWYADAILYLPCHMLTPSCICHMISSCICNMICWHHLVFVTILAAVFFAQCKHLPDLRLQHLYENWMAYEKVV